MTSGSEAHNLPSASDIIRVLFLNTRSALGADVAVHLSLIRSLDPARVRAHVATNRNSADLERTVELLKDSPHVPVRVVDLGAGSADGYGAAGNLGDAARNMRVAITLVRLAAYVRRNRIDVIHAGDRPRDALYSTILAKLTGRKHVIQVHIKWYPNIGRFPTMAMQRCDAVIAISEFTRRSFMEGGVPADKIHVALNATDTNVFDPARIRRGTLRGRFGLADDTPVVGVVGRVMLFKGQLELIDALAVARRSVPDLRLIIVGLEDVMLGAGAESYRAQVQRRIAEHGLEESVFWAGWYDSVPEVMADLDVLAVPSWEEPFGLVVTEGMAMERPVVSFRSGALPEIICDGVDGLLVEPKDSEAMGRAIAGLLSDPERRKEMGARARRTVIERFTPRRQAEDVERVYRTILGRGWPA